MIPLRCPPNACVNGTCNEAAGFTGFLCSQCEDSFYRSSKLISEAECSLCSSTSNPSLDVFVLICLGCVVLTYLVYGKTRSIKRMVSRHTLTGDDLAGQGNSRNTAVVQRLLLSQLQVISIVGKVHIFYSSLSTTVYNSIMQCILFYYPQFDYPWTKVVRGMFGILDTVSNAGFGSNISLSGGLKCWYQNSFRHVPLPFLELCVATGGFVMGLILVCLFWHVYGCINKNKPRMYQLMTISVIVLSFLLYSSLTRSFFEVFSCKTFVKGDGARLVGALDVECYSSLHLKYLGVIALPIGVVLILGLPLSAAAVLYRIHKSNTILEEYTLSTFGVKCFLEYVI